LHFNTAKTNLVADFVGPASDGDIVELGLLGRPELQFGRKMESGAPTGVSVDLLMNAGFGDIHGNRLRLGGAVQLHPSGDLVAGAFGELYK